ncbi:hypothetical protein AVEN_30183-1 [Araneus ventricosus]|uniref:Uncharacterized protein n=1 Tax=Araneus ventricosus TaxID=182803 RepID=A0A4Y2DPU1_ARAVE|nr:hypothetical protein AVEN_30183-1 [Araneus ventricosus]
MFTSQCYELKNAQESRVDEQAFTLVCWEEDNFADSLVQFDQRVGEEFEERHRLPAASVSCFLGQTRRHLICEPAKKKGSCILTLKGPALRLSNVKVGLIPGFAVSGTS